MNSDTYEETLEELFEKVKIAESDSTREDIVKVLEFFISIEKDYEPAIFILNLKLHEGLFRVMFDQLLFYLDNHNTFDVFSKMCPEFSNRVVSILTVSRDSSKIIFNPNHLSEGRCNNDFFTVDVIRSTKNTPLVKNYIETNQFNFRSFIKTITRKVQFSYSIRRDTINNKKINPTISSVGNQLFITEKIRDQQCPWLSTNKLVTFKVLVDGEKCISGGRPGIPGSIYITLTDRTSIILFRKGTSLIVGSKINQQKGLRGFMYRTLSNIQLLISIFHSYSVSPLHEETMNSVVVTKCSEDCNLGIECENCLIKTAVMNEINSNRQANVKIEYIRGYRAHNESIENELKILSSLIYDLELGKPLIDIVKRLSEFFDNDPTAVMPRSQVSVFGLKRKEVTNSGLFIQMPQSHKKNVSMFTGNRITFRSLKRVDHARSLIKLYDKILYDVRAAKCSIGNIFQYSDDELISIVDNYTNLFTHEFN